MNWPLAYRIVAGICQNNIGPSFLSSTKTHTQTNLIIPMNKSSLYLIKPLSLCLTVYGGSTKSKSPFPASSITVSKSPHLNVDIATQAYIFSTTQRYAHHCPESLRDATNMLDGYDLVTIRKGGKGLTIVNP